MGVMSPMGEIQASYIHPCIGKVFKEADKDNSGSIALDELAAFISNSKGRTPASTALLSNMIKALDTNGDSEIDANELRAIAF